MIKMLYTEIITETVSMI